MRLIGFIALAIAFLYLCLYKSCYDHGYKNATSGLLFYHSLITGLLLFIGIGGLLYKERSRGMLSNDHQKLSDPTSLISTAVVPDVINPAYWIDLGEEKLGRGDYHNAILDYNKSIELEPNSVINSIAYYSRGIAKQKIGDMTCCSDWQKAKELGLEEYSMKLIRKYCIKKTGDIIA
jgi:hypothetical protein